MKSIKLFTLLCCVTAGNTKIIAAPKKAIAMPQITMSQIDITNNTNTSLDVSFSLPEQTIASIQIKKIEQFKKVEQLHAAILNDSAEKIRQAVLEGANINQERDGKTPLLWAILLKHYNAIEALLQLGARADDICGQQAIKMQDMRSLLLLVNQGQRNLDLKAIVDVISGSISPSPHHKYDAINLIRALVNHGYDINELWYAAIRLSFYSSHEGEEAVRFLISRGANPNYIKIGGDTPLKMVIDSRCYDKQIVKILMEAGADIHRKIEPQGKRSLLAHAIENNRYGDKNKIKEVIEFLLEHGANL